MKYSNINNRARKVKGYEYFICGFLFCLLFIILLRRPDSTGSGFLASYYSPSRNCLAEPVQGSFIKSESLFHGLGGHSIIPSTPTSGKGGGLAATVRPPLSCEWLDELIEKIQLIESGGLSNPPDGDGGKAIGPLQIHSKVVDDVNQKFGTNFSHEDCRDIEKSKLIAKLYISMWMDIHKEEIAARIYNGGPRGWQKKSTDRYWEKVQAAK